MIKVNPFFLHTLLEPLTGLADDDDAVLRYRSLDPNSEEQVRAVIRACIVPHAKSLPSNATEKVRLAYRYYLSKNDSKFDRVFYSNLLPFDAPDDPRLFFNWVWDECFPNEEYRINEIENYVENADVNEPLGT